MENQYITSVDTLPEKIKINTTHKNIDYGFSLNNGVGDNKTSEKENNEGYIEFGGTSSVFGRQQLCL